MTGCGPDRDCIHPPEEHRGATRIGRAKIAFFERDDVHSSPLFKHEKCYGGRNRDEPNAAAEGGTCEITLLLVTRLTELGARSGGNPNVLQWIIHISQKRGVWVRSAPGLSCRPNPVAIEDPQWGSIPATSVAT